MPFRETDLSNNTSNAGDQNTRRGQEKKALNADEWQAHDQTVAWRQMMGNYRSARDIAQELTKMPPYSEEQGPRTREYQHSFWKAPGGALAGTQNAGEHFWQKVLTDEQRAEIRNGTPDGERLYKQYLDIYNAEAQAGPSEQLEVRTITMKELGYCSAAVTQAAKNADIPQEEANQICYREHPTFQDLVKNGNFDTLTRKMTKWKDSDIQGEKIYAKDFFKFSKV